MSHNLGASSSLGSTQPKDEEHDNVKVEPRSYSRDLSYLSSVDGDAHKEVDENRNVLGPVRGVKRRYSTEDDDGRDNGTSDCTGREGTSVNKHDAGNNGNDVSGHRPPIVSPDPRTSLLLPVRLNTDDLPVEYREFLMGARQNACTACVEQKRRVCWQSPAHSWKCQHCHETRRKCSWQFDCAQHGLGNNPRLRVKAQSYRENSQGKRKKTKGLAGGASLRQQDPAGSAIEDVVSSLFLPSASLPAPATSAPPATFQPLPCAVTGTVDLLKEIKTAVDSSNVRIVAIDDKFDTLQKNVDCGQRENREQLAKFKQEIVELVMKARVGRRVIQVLTGNFFLLPGAGVKFLDGFQFDFLVTRSRKILTTISTISCANWTRNRIPWRRKTTRRGTIARTDGIVSTLSLVNSVEEVLRTKSHAAMYTWSRSLSMKCTFQKVPQVLTTAEFSMCDPQQAMPLNATDPNDWATVHYNTCLKS
ncbi:hypothetical protein LXA43DRAFT_1101987 [Ganoderma leucocontextum]|nr:hypothetical protein LXA43DRAFT_1101987 [Ganoderma leucocontextum]